MISENLDKIRAEMPSGVQVVAVSKLKPAADVLTAWQCGQRAFGENYATELREKAAVLPGELEWHFVGHLQAKQLKYYIGFVKLIHGVDTVEHLMDVERAAAKVGRVVDCLLQVHVAQELTKFGFVPDELPALSALPETPHVRVRGLMGMASHVEDVGVVRGEFRRLRTLFEGLRDGQRGEEFDTLSMGMSHDWRIAVEEGSTMVRLGTSIFGKREYKK